MHIYDAVTKNLCNHSSIRVLFKKVIYKWMEVPDFWEGPSGKIRLNVKACPFLQRLSREFFQFFLDKLEKIALHLFDSHPQPPSP